jgi:hypothetical protein
VADCDIRGDGYRLGVNLLSVHEGTPCERSWGNKPQVNSAITIQSSVQISWKDLLHQGQAADVSIIRAKTGTFSIETLDVHLAP